MIENRLDYGSYQNLMNMLPADVQVLNRVSSPKLKNVSQVGYAIGHFTQSAAWGDLHLKGLDNIVDSLSDTGTFDRNNVVTYSDAINLASAAVRYGASSADFVTSTGQYAYDLNNDHEEIVVGLMPDTQARGQAWLLQDGLMHRYANEGVELVLAVGDLTNTNTQEEYDHWLRVMNNYTNTNNMKVLPVRGNHENEWWLPDGGSNIYIQNVGHLIEDAEHLPGYENLTYAYKYKNILVISVDVYIHNNQYEFDSGKSAFVTAFPWMKEMVAKYHDEVDHIILMTHEPLFGRYYPGQRENIDKATNGAWDGDPNEIGIKQRERIQKFLADNNILYVSGHDHQYSRSAILIDETRKLTEDRIKNQESTNRVF
ncbi:hypothetical protein JCM19231_5199 [Vibrio ishigakensis]|uniref:Calcineurin-like phosphoesterase domain-containing protein n=1 Tax=Vibrio ishigakensis TaxID=1481914 RepID=A0A0B8NPW3_9VIBR|nr:hypothetical protein JCM19231_5199 [Vibrio ishigakensis]